MAFENEYRSLKRKVEEIAALTDLYDEIVSSNPKGVTDIEAARLEAKFAREELLRLSLEVKELITRLETREAVK
jgi:hypothetical protein